MQFRRWNGFPSALLKLNYGFLAIYRAARRMIEGGGRAEGLGERVGKRQFSPFLEAFGSGVLIQFIALVYQYLMVFDNWGIERYISQNRDL
jgi:hypothetical protein